MRGDLVTVGRKWATSPTMKDRVNRVRVATWLFSSTVEDSMFSLTASSDQKEFGSKKSNLGFCKEGVLGSSGPGDK